ncbi:MAG TPA: molybdopterin dinucleotide binding domain-containing protein, partial [Dissulfurispiraceae bacterium]|nr:molybdopterin dinucleotide binding domain-containing protein [Dissulfurispiraceae bacterium]
HLRSDGKPGFPTPSGKFEFVSGLLSRHGYDQLPVYMHQAAGSLPLDLLLTTGARTRTRFNSHHAGSSCMSAAREEAVLDIHPYDASTRNIKDGDTIMLTTQRGAVTLQAHVTKDIARGVVHAPLPGGREGKLFGQRCGQVNRVMPSELCDPISGYPAVKAVPCCVSTVRLAKRTLHPSEAQPS